MSITMAQSCLLSQHSLLYTKTKFPIISNSVKPFKLQNPSSFNNNSSTFSRSLPLTSRRKTRHSSFLTFAGDEGNSEDPYKSLNVFISNLPDGLRLGKLSMLFEEVGIVDGALLNAGNVDGKSFASVTMSTVEEVEKAIEKFNGYVLNGKLLTVSREKPKPRRAYYRAHFYISVSNLPKDVDSGRLKEIFSKYGRVYEVRIDYNERLDESTGSLIMINETQMNNAIAALDGQNLDGKVIRLFVETLETM
ncbi:RNA-binding protein CP31B, chloroplastic-like [Trifolium pratense]|uniref:Uncharacterized protein n=1 Tax=Trifolium pratense TaxID=57577 RepID=A0ACB0I761_TRIPR|nr:RNA-binding protein CP31B, chloroplastic-like [Trifolium pratense]CAJ2627910.1 unnamed protein product [Trifolium pratense]